MQETTEGFELFVEIVDAGSISAAARALGVPRETLSRRLARLEERLEVRLLHRDTRRLVPTPAGEQLYRRARPLVAAAREATAAVRALDGVPRGLLRVSIPPGGSLFTEVCASFVDRYPEVSLEVMGTARYVDLVADGFDVALRGGPQTNPSLVARKLWSAQQLAVAAPAYLAARGTPRTLDDLADHACLVGYEGGVRPARTWPTTDGGTVPVAGPIASNDLVLLWTAALRGHGITLLPGTLIQDDLDAGRLVPVLADRIGRTIGISVVFVERAFMLPKVRAFVDHAVEWFARERPMDRGMASPIRQGG